MGRDGGRGATGLSSVGGLCHFFVRSRVACVVSPLLWCVLGVLVVWLRHSQGWEPRCASARLVGWLVPLSGAGAVTAGVQGGAFRSSPPHPLFRLLVCCGSPWPRFRSVLSLRQATGR